MAINWDEWADKWDAEFYREIRVYNQKFTSYILKKANNDSKVELAINTLIVVTLHQTMALVLAPKCPGEYQAQVDALKATLDKVLDYLHSDRHNKEAESQLENEVVTVRQQEFLKFLGRCAGFEVKFEELGLDKVRELDKAFRTPRGNYYQTEVIKKAPPSLQVPPSPKAIELAQAHAKALEEYHSQLVEYILQKTNMDLQVPLALMGLEISYLNNNMAVLFLFAEPNPCQEFFTGDTLVDVVDTIEAIWNYFEHARGSRKINDLASYEVDAMGDSVDGAHEFLSWMDRFILGMAECYGIDINLVAVPKGNTVELKLVKYEPLEPDTEPDSQGSQDAPTN